ncbi:MAG: hypothetical protein HYV09_31510 [Deltaproteobacteria bacterium]|nr:hypothetical protein [Deltaproteobacteria bacterium]
MFKRASHPAQLSETEGDEMRRSGIPSRWHAGAAAKEWAQLMLAFLALVAIFAAFWYSTR